MPSPVGSGTKLGPLALGQITSTHKRRKQMRSRTRRPVAQKRALTQGWRVMWPEPMTWGTTCSFSTCSVEWAAEQRRLTWEACAWLQLQDLGAWPGAVRCRAAAVRPGLQPRARLDWHAVSVRKQPENQLRPVIAGSRKGGRLLYRCSHGIQAQTFHDTESKPVTHIGQQSLVLQQVVSGQALQAAGWEEWGGRVTWRARLRVMQAGARGRQGWGGRAATAA